jgi:aspartate racemase
MIGGLGAESTIDYYRSILARYRERKPDGTFPQIVINSLDVNKGIAMLEAGRLGELTDYLAAGLQLLSRAGADFAFIAANTPHLVFDDVERRSEIPLLSIVRATADHAKAKGLKHVALFGTGFTMRAGFYRDEFRRAGIAVVIPRESEQDFIHKKYLGELLNNQFLPETKSAILDIARRMKTDEGVEAVVLAGTELPLLLRGPESTGIDFLDTTIIHVEAIVDRIIAHTS